MVTLQLLEFVEALDMPHFTPYYIYDINVDERYVGRLVFRLGSDEDHYYDGHIGYTIEPEYRGHHYAYHACQALKPIIRDMGYDHVLITCDPDNLPSLKTIEALKAELIDIVDIPSSLRRVFGEDEITKAVYRWEVTK